MGRTLPRAAHGGSGVAPRSALFAGPLQTRLRGFVREDWVAGLDFDTLERVRECGISQDLREREDDILWRLRWGERWLYVYLILDFSPPWTASWRCAC